MTGGVRKTTREQLSAPGFILFRKEMIKKSVQWYNQIVRICSGKTDPFSSPLKQVVKTYIKSAVAVLFIKGLAKICRDNKVFIHYNP